MDPSDVGYVILCIVFLICCSYPKMPPPSTRGQVNPLLSLRSNEQTFLKHRNTTHLFMFRVLGANVIHSAFPNDNGATVAHWLDGCTDFHASGESWRN